MLSVDDSRHGTFHGYNGCGCRCEPCRNAAREYRAKKFASDPEKGRALAAKNRVSSAAWRLANPDRARQGVAKYREAHREEARTATAAWYIANQKRAIDNATRWKAANPEKVRASNAKYHKANPDVARSSWMNRRARKIDQWVEDVDRDVVWARDSGICHLCNLPADPVDWHLDHVSPLALGGEHSYANTAVSHPFCNLSKGARPVNAVA